MKRSSNNNFTKVFLPRIAGPPKPRLLPEGWSVRQVHLDSDLVVDLPCPTRAAFFWSSGDSFQGPIRLGF